MANELQTKLDAILLDKNTNLKPENLKKGITLLGVEGTLTGGIDTSSDNPILADDVAEGKEGFVNDKKVVGIVPKVVANLVVQANDVQLFDDEQKMWFSHIYDEDHPNGVMYPKFTWNQIESSYSEVAEKIGLAADKIKAGETILGITGTCAGQDIDVYTQAIHTLYADTSNMVFEKHSFADMGLIFPDNITLAEDINGQVPFYPYVTDSSNILDAGILVNESSNVVYPYFVGDKNCVYAFDKMLNFTTKIEGRAETNGYVYANGNFKLYGNGTQMIWISSNSNITLDDYTSGNVLSLTLQNQSM